MAVNALTEMPRAFPIFDTKGKMAAIWVLWFQAFIANLPPIGSGYVIDGSAGTYGPTTIFQGADINKGTSPTHGQVYIAVDTGNIYVEQAGNWVVENGAFSGDVTKAAHSSVLTLTTVNFAPGTYGGGGNVPIITVDGKGRVVSSSEEPITISPPGPPLSIIYNDGAELAGSPNFTYDNVTTTSDIMRLRQVQFRTYPQTDGIGFTLTGRSYNQTINPGSIPDSLSFIAGSETSTPNSGARLEIKGGKLAGPGEIKLAIGSNTYEFLPTGDLNINGDSGVSKQSLISNGAGFAPTWQNIVNSINPGTNITVDTTTGDVTINAIPTAPNFAVQYNNGSVFGGSSNFLYNDGTKTITLAPYMLDTTTVAGFLSVRNTTANASSTVATRSSGTTATNSGVFTMERSRGTLGAPVLVNSGDRLGALSFRGYDGTTFQTGAAILSTTTQAFSGTQRGTNLTFLVDIQGTNTLRTLLGLSHNGTNPIYVFDANPMFRQTGVWTFQDSFGVTQATINNSSTAIGGATTDLIRLSDLDTYLPNGPLPFSNVPGDLLVSDGTNWQLLPADMTGLVLTSNGFGVAPSYQPEGHVGDVTSIDVSGGASGLSFTGGPITSAGTITITGGALDIGYGGTSATTAQAAINALIGAGTVGDILIYDGTNWTPLPPGSSGQVLTITPTPPLVTWVTPSGPGGAPEYAYIVSLSGQMVFNPSCSTIANGGGLAYLQVFVNGAKQREGGSYTVTGANEITFAVGLNVNDEVEFYAF